MARIADQFRACHECGHQFAAVSVTGALVTEENRAAVTRALICGMGGVREAWLVPTIDVVGDVALVVGGSASFSGSQIKIAQVCVDILRAHGIAARNDSRP